MKSLWRVLLIVTIATITFSQTKSIGIWVQYVDYDGEYVNLLNALDSATFDYELHEYWTYSSITAESLSQIDVFITPELESGGYSMGRPAGFYLSTILHSWVNSGGLLISMYIQGKDFINGADFDSIGGTSGYTSGAALTVALPTHPLAEGVAASFSGMNASNAYSYYGDYTPVVTNASAYMHTGFQEFGSGAVVFFGWDYFEAITPNQDRLFQNAIDYWGMRSEGPILRTFTPTEGNVIAGYPTVRMEFQDEEGIDITSLQFYLNGAMFTGYDPIVTAIGDTVFIDIPDTMSDGEVTFRIRNIEDSAGHEGPDTSHIYNFYIDNTPPELGYHEPMGIMTYIPDGAMIKYSDEISGTNSMNWYLYVDGVDTVKCGRPGVIVEGDTLVLVAFYLADIIPTPSDTNWIEFGVWDAPDEGEPNLEVYRWWYVPAVGICENLPTEMEFAVWPNPFNSACRITAPEGATVEIFDIDGRSVASFQNTDNIWQPDESIGSGVYLIRARVGNESVAKRVVYLK